MRFSLLIITASLCFLPSVRADSVFNFDSDMVGSYTSFTDTNNGLSATFSSNSGVFVGPVTFPPNADNYHYPLVTLSGNELEASSYLADGTQIAGGPTIDIMFSGNVTSVQFNFALLDIPAENPVTVEAFENGFLVGSETSFGAEPAQDGPAPGAANYYPEGIGGFAGPSFNSITINDPSAILLLVDNIDVAAVPEPGALGEFLGLSAIGVAMAVRRRSQQSAVCKRLPCKTQTM